MWTDEMFTVKKPIIALLHLHALPGDPLYGPESMEQVVESARRDLRHLQDGGVDGVLFANEFSLPYEHTAPYVIVAAMARIVGELRADIRVPFGVNVVLNPLASVELAVATGARFVRSTFTGAYIGESGITDTDIAAVLRRRTALDAQELKLLFKVNPESDAYIAPRPIERITRSILFHCFPDGLCVSGASAGTETDTDIIDQVRAVAGGVPVFCNTGCTIESIAHKLEHSDGACVGTAFKKDGAFRNDVDPGRVAAFMGEVRRYRNTL